MGVRRLVFRFFIGVCFGACVCVCTCVFVRKYVLEKSLINIKKCTTDYNRIIFFYCNYNFISYPSLLTCALRSSPVCPMIRLLQIMQLSPVTILDFLFEVNYGKSVRSLSLLTFESSLCTSL